MAGLISAISALNIGQSHIGITPPQWIPTRDAQGDITGDGWDPAPRNGTLWFDTRQGRLMVWVNDGFYQTNGRDRFSVVADDAPLNPVSGQAWYNSLTDVYYIYDGSKWVAISGGEGSFSALTNDIAVIQNQVDEISVRRSNAREYEVFNINNSPQAPIGKISLNSLSVDDITLIAIGSEDINQIISQPGEGRDLIDLESSNGEIVRFSIAGTSGDAYVVTKVTGTRNLTLGETLKVYVYPQNSEYATVTFTTNQIDTLQDQINSLQISVTSEQMQALQTDLTALTTTVNNISTGATPEQISAIQVQIDNNDADITAANSSISAIDTRLTTVETNLSDYATVVELNTLTTLANTTEASVTTLQSTATSLQSQIDDINNTKLVNIENEIDALETELGNRNTIHYSDTVPTTATLGNGDLWFDSTNLRILVYHQNMWINPDRSAGGVLVDEKQIYYQNVAPTGSHLNEGDLWFDNTTLRLNVYHQNSWIISDQVINATRSLIVDAAQNTSDFASFRQYIIDNA